MARRDEVLAIVSTLRYIDCMFKLPDFPSVDFSKFDVDALRNIDVSKYVPAVNFPQVRPSSTCASTCRPSTSPS